MKVLHVTLSFSPGGRREAIATLCSGLAELGVENYLCCLNTLGAGADVCAPLFVDTLELRRRRLLDFRALQRLRTFCVQRGIDILHSHDAASQTACALATLGRSVPLLMSFHRSRDFESARPRDRLRNALVGLRTRAIVAASSERCRHYRRENHVAMRKVLRIPLGIDLERFRPNPAGKADLHARLNLPADRLLVGVVGHFGPEKGVDLALDAFQDMCRRHPAIRADLVVLGSGTPERTAYVSRRIDPALAARIHLVGFQQQPDCWTSGFDVLLHGARAEAFGLVLVEAMACAVPVVAPAVGGIPDIVRDGESGRLVAGPDAELLSAALAELLENADQRARLAQGALRVARSEFGRCRYAHRFFDLYGGMLGKQPV